MKWGKKKKRILVTDFVGSYCSLNFPAISWKLYEKGSWKYQESNPGPSSYQFSMLTSGLWRFLYKRCKTKYNELLKNKIQILSMNLQEAWLRFFEIFFPFHSYLKNSLSAICKLMMCTYFMTHNNWGHQVSEVTRWLKYQNWDIYWQLLTLTNTYWHWLTLTDTYRHLMTCNDNEIEEKGRQNGQKENASQMASNQLVKSQMNKRPHAASA